MNSENIKQLIELFGKLGESSKEAFFWFLFLDFAKFAIGILLGLTIAYMAYRLIRKSVSSEEQERALKRLAREAGLGDHSRLSDYDIKNILEHYLKKEK